MNWWRRNCGGFGVRWRRRRLEKSRSRPGTQRGRWLRSWTKCGGFDSGWTKIFISPGYSFKVVQGIITNFHLPKSTLVMLVSAFAGRDNVLAAYEHAVKEKYRFFSFGDAMFIK